MIAREPKEILLPSAGSRTKVDQSQRGIIEGEKRGAKRVAGNASVTSSAGSTRTNEMQEEIFLEKSQDRSSQGSSERLVGN